MTDPWLAQAAVVHVLDPHGEQARTGLREFVAADGSINLTAPMLIADIMSDPALATADDRRALETRRRLSDWPRCPAMLWLQWNGRYHDDVLFPGDTAQAWHRIIVSTM